MSTRKKLDKRKHIKEKVYEYLDTIQRESRYLSKFVGRDFDGYLFTGCSGDVFDYLDADGNIVKGDIKDEMKIVKNIDEISIFHLMQYLKHLHYIKHKHELLYNSHSVEFILLNEFTGESCVNVELHSHISSVSSEEYSFYTNCYKLLIDEQDERTINKIYEIIEELL